jgi:hypothetical protein
MKFILFSLAIGFFAGGNVAICVGAIINETDVHFISVIGAISGVVTVGIIAVLAITGSIP